jgi:Tfp pilus assembly protein PilN
MKAVNLIPGDARSARGIRLPKLAVPTYALIGVLVGAIVLVTLQVMASNSVADRQAQVTSIQAQLTQAQQAASKLSAYGQFTSLEQARVQSVRGIAATRFDWNSALGQLATVIPANTSLQSISGSVVPGATAGGSGSGGGGLRSDLTGPAFEIQGCTSNQDEVARLISRLRTMTGVTRVALSSSAKAGGQTASPSSGSTTGPKRGCPTSAPTFDLIVFYRAVAGAGAQGATALGTSTTTTPNGGTK